jgi:hypothetical protein
LAYNQIGIAGAIFLADALSYNKHLIDVSLIEIGLQRNPIADCGVTSICNALMENSNSNIAIVNYINRLIGKVVR